MLRLGVFGSANTAMETGNMTSLGARIAVPVVPSLYLIVTKNAQGLDGSLIAPVFHSAVTTCTIPKARFLENFTGTSTALLPFAILKTPLTI